MRLTYNQITSLQARIADPGGSHLREILTLGKGLDGDRNQKVAGVGH